MAFGGKPTAGAVLDGIRLENRDQSEKGRWFERLFMRIAFQELDFEIDSVWRWPPNGPRAMSLRDGRDIGILQACRVHSE